ncbi:MAG: signal recognition particle receptor subunit alpha, partial [Myxococcales bacterium]|nr:signal recognition particle receptor subunit alpha [Myxococcales bacterium]
MYVRFWRRSKHEEVTSEAEIGAAVAEAPPIEEPTAEEREEIHEQTEKALQRTRRGLFGRIGGLFERADFDESLWDELEEILVASDTGLATTEALLASVRRRTRDEGVKQSQRVREILREELISILEAPRDRPLAWLAP